MCKCTYIVKHGTKLCPGWNLYFVRLFWVYWFHKESSLLCLNMFMYRMNWWAFPCFIRTNSRFLISLGLMEEITPSVDVNTVKQRYQCPVLLCKHVSAVCVMICLKYLHVHLSLYTFQAESSVANVSQSSCVLSYLFMCSSLWNFFSKASHFWLNPKTWSLSFSLLDSGAGQVAPFSGKEVTAPWGKLCCPSVLSSAPCLEQWNELQNIASRLQGRLQMAFLIFLMC